MSECKLTGTASKVQVITTRYYLASPRASPGASPLPALQEVFSLDSSPPGGLLFVLEHPDPASNSAARFFFACLPDLAGWALHALNFAGNCLGVGVPSPRRFTLSLGGGVESRDGRIVIPLDWVEALMEENGDCVSCTIRFKALILRELTRAILDDNGTPPQWLADAMVAYVVISSGLGPVSRMETTEGKCGDAAGGLFLAWLVGVPVSADGPSKPPSPAPFPDLVKQLTTRLETEAYSEEWWPEMTGKTLYALWAVYHSTDA